MSVSRRLIGSFSATLLGPVVTVLLQLINVPIMLRKWGPELFGEWLVLSAIPTYLLLSDLGFGNVAGSDMTMRVHAGDREGALETFQSTQALTLLTSAAITVVLLPMLLFTPIQRLLHLSALTSGEARMTLLLLSINCLVLLQWSVIMAGYRATERYALGTLYVNCIRTVEGASVFVILFSNARPQQLAGLMLVISVLGTALLASQLLRGNTWLSFGTGAARWSKIMELSRPAFAYMSFPASAALSTQGMTLLIGVLLGPLAVAVYNPMRTLSRFVLQISNAISNSVWAELSAAFGRNDLPLARRLHRSACQMALLLALLGTIALALAGPYLFALWTHGRIPFDARTFYVLLLTAMAYSGWFASASVLLATNRHQQVAVLYLVCTATSIGLAAVLTRPLGMLGAALAALLCDVVMSFFVLRMSNRLLQESWSDFGTAMLDTTLIKTVPARLMGSLTRSAIASPTEDV